MRHAEIAGGMIDDQTLDILTRERGMALSAREWTFRIAGYGFGVKDIDGARVLTKLPQNTELGVLPAHLN